MCGRAPRGGSLAGAGALSVALLAGCYRLPEATVRFERDLSCPRRRLTAEVRADLQAHDFACLEQPGWRAHGFGGANAFWQAHPEGSLVACGDPPEAIRGDAGRVAVWRAIRDRSYAELDGRVGPIYEVVGCGERRFYGFDGVLSEIGAVDPRGAR